tara:strand:- start:264 stop:383 length:120 start_codon:yes stop_codon:yes gene_type:complete
MRASPLKLEATSHKQQAASNKRQALDKTGFKDYKGCRKE